ncbi:hypothetical protein D3C80_1587210 [compost metagenome]
MSTTTPFPCAFAALTAPIIVASPTAPIMVTKSAPALNAISASSSPASAVFISAKTSLLGCAFFIAVITAAPIFLISGVPSSIIST